MTTVSNISLWQPVQEIVDIILWFTWNRISQYNYLSFQDKWNVWHYRFQWGTCLDFLKKETCPSNFLTFSWIYNKIVYDKVDKVASGQKLPEIWHFTSWKWFCGHIVFINDTILGTSVNKSWYTPFLFLGLYYRLQNYILET